jgi:hypothetical protein
MGYVDLKSMEMYQHQELKPLWAVINKRNLAKKEHEHQQIPADSELGHILGHTF